MGVFISEVKTLVGAHTKEAVVLLSLFRLPWLHETENNQLDDLALALLSSELVI